MSWIFQRKIFLPENWENGPKLGQKQVFLNLLKNFLINFYWICSIVKIYIVCPVHAQIPHLGKFLFLRLGQNVLGQSDCRIFLSNISPEQNNVVAWFFACWYKSGYNWLYLKNESMEWTVVLHAGANSVKLKLFYWFLVEHGQEWT